MPRGGKRAGAGRPPGSGRRCETRGISLPADLWLALEAIAREVGDPRGRSGLVELAIREMFERARRGDGTNG